MGVIYICEEYEMILANENMSINKMFLSVSNIKKCISFIVYTMKLLRIDCKEKE